MKILVPFLFVPICLFSLYAGSSKNIPKVNPELTQTTKSRETGERIENNKTKQDKPDTNSDSSLRKIVSTNRNQPEANERDEHSEQSIEIQERMLASNIDLTRYTRLGMIASTVVGIFAIVIGAIGFWNAWLARDHTKQELRAYVHIRKSSIENVSNLNGHIFVDGSFNANPTASPTYIFKIRNYGKTPAIRLTHRCNIIIAEYPSPNERLFNTDVLFDKIKNFVSERDLPPNDPDGVLVEVPLHLPLTDPQMDGLREGRLAIYIYGEIRYTDSFENNRITRFRYAHWKRENMFNDRFVICPRGNEIT